MEGSIIGLLSILPSLLVFLVFLDYHRKDNIHKAIRYVVVFIGLAILFCFVLLPALSFYIAVLVPVLLLVYLLIARS